MADYIDNNLQSIRKSLADVVLPSVDPDDPLALEQMNLTIDYLGFLQQRLDFIADRARFDFDHYRQMTELLLDAGLAEADRATLSDELAHTEKLNVAIAKPSEIRAISERLARVIDEMVGRVADAPEETRTRVERIVVDASQAWIEMELSWYAPIAVDPDGPGVSPLKSFFPDQVLL